MNKNTPGRVHHTGSMPLPSLSLVKKAVPAGGVDLTFPRGRAFLPPPLAGPITGAGRRNQPGGRERRGLG
jgi:hypothetical protein